MCGIAGMLTSRGLPFDELEGTAEAMASELTHRGPDDRGTFADPGSGIALGFRRLAILDLSPRGNQPMKSRTGRFVLVFNGEVYNYASLRDELEATGHSFRSSTDSEVVLGAVEEWGMPRALERFNGMFALAVWDRKKSELCLARDRLGIKPLYVYRDRTRLAFASELSAISRIPDFDSTLDLGALASYLRHLYVPSPRSIYEKVSKLEPGHYLTVDGSRVTDDVSSVPYWSVETAIEGGRRHPYTGGEERALDRLEALLTEAVSLRTRADVPVGALLSGGIDSTAVVALLQKVTADPIRTYTIGFDAEEHDESRHARRIARHLSTEHRELSVDRDRVLEAVPELDDILDEPFADPSLIPTFLISRLARREVTVALSGDGGDEVFGGYNRYRFGAPLLRHLPGVPRGARAPVSLVLRSVSSAAWSELHERISPLIPEALQHRLPGEKATKLGHLLRQEGDAAMYRSLLSAWHDPLTLVAAAEEARDVIDEAFARDAPYLDRMMAADQMQYLPGDLLAKVDRASMANSLEVRVPILDHRIVEFAWRLPPEMKVRGRHTKWILREVVDRHVPRELVDRPKVGFSVPLANWLRGPLRTWTEDLLSAERLVDDGVFRPEPIRTAWKSLRDGHSERALQLWTILMFQVWAADNPWSLPD